MQNQLSKQLTTDEQINLVILNKITVKVFLGSHLIGHGIIESHNEDAVIIDDERYLKMVCKFYL